MLEKAAFIIKFWQPTFLLFSVILEKACCFYSALSNISIALFLSASRKNKNVCQWIQLVNILHTTLVCDKKYKWNFLWYIIGYI